MTTRIHDADGVGVFQGAMKQMGVEQLADFNDIGNAVIAFKKVENFTTFWAEYAFVDGNIVVHFFPTPEAYVQHGSVDRKVVNETFLRSWKIAFPHVLSPAAESYFKATAPVLEATYVAEMTSWWLRAGGFANRLNPDAFVLGFFAELDARLDAV